MQSFEGLCVQIGCGELRISFSDTGFVRRCAGVEGPVRSALAKRLESQSRVASPDLGHSEDEGCRQYQTHFFSLASDGVVVVVVVVGCRSGDSLDLDRWLHQILPRSNPLKWSRGTYQPQSHRIVRQSSTARRKARKRQAAPLKKQLPVIRGKSASKTPGLSAVSTKRERERERGGSSNRGLD